MSLLPHDYWQVVYPADSHVCDSERGYAGAFPASLPDGGQILLPIRVLPGDGASAVASLIVNQASFAVVDALCDAMADRVRPYEPEVVVGMPTLGLPLAEGVARRLGHSRLVALGTSRKFWYRDDLSEPLRSITSPDQTKTLFIDPRMLPLLAGRRVLLVDDVVSSGASAVSALRLLAKAGIRPVAMAVAMKQGTRWEKPIAEAADIDIVSAIASPHLALGPDGFWRATI